MLNHLKQDSRFIIDEFDPKVLKLPNDMSGKENQHNATFKSRLAACDAFIVVTPEYNHGYPAALKLLIDSAHVEWQRKPVAFVSYGGISGGLRAVEQLRQVFAELHSVSLRDSLSLAHPWELFDHSGNLKQPQKLTDNLRHMLNHLKWWGNALTYARTQTALT